MWKGLKNLSHYYVCLIHQSLSEPYYITGFLSELKKDIRPMLKILKLATLIQAFDYAK